MKDLYFIAAIAATTLLLGFLNDLNQYWNLIDQISCILSSVKYLIYGDYTRAIDNLLNYAATVQESIKIIYLGGI